MEKIIDLLIKCDHEYFNFGTSSITDTEYDLLRKEAKEKYPNHPYFQTVGAPADTKFEKIKLIHPMGGLEKVDSESVIDLFKKYPGDWIASEKLDGNSVEVGFENGNLFFAASRGDGTTGQNLLKKLIYVISPISFKDRVIPRAEVMFKGDDYVGLGKNRRNATTGTLRQDKIEPPRLKKLSIIYYDLMEFPENLKLKTQLDRIKFLESLGVECARYIFLAKEVSPELKAKILEEFLLKMKETANYDIDGLVLTLNESPIENSLSPQYKYKFKVNEQAVRCKVVDIEWNVTRIGYVKPVVIIEPVDIMGATVSRCSGFNYNFINANQIGIGSEIGVVRSGDVIPFIVEIYKTVKPNIPLGCPSCGEKLSFSSNLTGEAVDLICLNEHCKDKLIYNVSHFFISMGVEGLSDKTFENIGITTINEVYGLTKEKLENLPGFGEKKAENIIKEVKNTLKTKPEKLLAAFGIPLIGRTLSRQICNKFSFDELFTIKNPDDLGLGKITSETFIKNIGNYKKLYEFLKSIGLEFEKEDPSMKTLKGLKFALTGEGPMKRSEIQKLIEAKGGEMGGISKGTNYLVTNDPSSSSGKMKSAQKLGIPIINYDSLFQDYLN